MWALGRSNWRGVQSPGQRILLSSMIPSLVCTSVYGSRLNAEMTVCQWWMFAKGLMDLSGVWIWGQLRSTLYSSIWFWSALTLHASSYFYFIHLHLSAKWQTAETWQMMFILEKVPSAPRALRSLVKLVVFFLWFMLGSFFNVHDLTNLNMQRWQWMYHLRNVLIKHRITFTERIGTFTSNSFSLIPYLSSICIPSGQTVAGYFSH